MAGEWVQYVAVAANIGTAIGAAFTGGSLYYGYKAMREGDRARRLDRTYALLERFAADYSEDERNLQFKYFPGRWGSSEITPLSQEKGRALWAVSMRDSAEDLDVVQEYTVAKRHLNRLSTLASAYLHDTVERGFLVAQVYAVMARSDFFFRTLIDAAGNELGDKQAWQVIPKAVRMMKEEDLA